MSGNPDVQPVRIATRASSLALWQANHVAELLRTAAPDRTVEVVHVSTIGDRDKTEPLHQMGGMGVFTREVQKAVLDGRADVAVHSLKDLPTEPAADLTLAAVPSRASMFDALVLPASASATSLATLPAGARVGTGSLRRQAQLLNHRSDLQMLEIRGNVPTRLQKLDDGEYDALVLAVAGLTRLELDSRINEELQPPLMLPAVGQGALGIECRSNDSDTLSVLQQISDESTHAAVTAERSLLAELRAGCHAPLGVLTSRVGNSMSLEAVVLSRDGSERLVASESGPASDPASIGRLVADNLRRQGADRLIQDSSGS